MAGINLKLVTPSKGRVSLGPSGNLGPKSKLQPNAALGKIPTKQPPRAPKITHSPAIAGMAKGRSAGRAPLGGTMTQKAAPGSFTAAAAVAKVLNNF